MMEWYFDTFGCRNVICHFAIKFIIFVYTLWRRYILYTLQALKSLSWITSKIYINILKLNNISAQSNKIKILIVIFKLRPIP